MLRDLNFFQLENRLHREAHYPESEIFHWAIVAALIVTESLANSYFFAKVSDLGLLGGAFQALLISVVNIGAALLAGVYLMRNLHHISQLRVILAGAGLACYLGFMGFFNLATAHYRAQLGIDPLAALVNALSSLASDQVGINDFDATVLLFIGIIFPTAALIKAYMADDQYPEYGKFHRRYRETVEDDQEGKQELRDAVNGVIDHARDILDRYVEDAREAGREFATLVTDADSLINGFARHVEELREASHTLLNLYRTTNIKARSSQSPDYFEDYPPKESDETLPRGDLERMKSRIATIEADLGKIETHAASIMQDLKQVNETAINDVEQFFQIIEDEADKRITNDAALVLSSDEEEATI